MEKSKKPHLTFCVSVKPLATLGHNILSSFFLDPEDIRSLTLGIIWNIIKEEVSRDWDISSGAQKACQKSYVHRDRKGSNPFTILYYSVPSQYILFSSILCLKYSTHLFLQVRKLMLQAGPSSLKIPPKCLCLSTRLHKATQQTSYAPYAARRD